MKIYEQISTFFRGSSIGVSLLALVLLVGGATLAGANTVMVYVHEDGPAIDDNATRDFLEGVEDGLIEVLFENGIIAFSIGSTHNAAEHRAAPRYFAISTAEHGGAQFVINVGVYTNGSRNGDLRFDQGRLTVQSVPDGRVIREVELQPRNGAISRGERGFRAGSVLGREAAVGVLPVIH